MKSKMILIVLLFFTLVACSKPTPGLEEVTNVPEDIQEYVNSEYRLQSVRDDAAGSYIIFHSTGNVAEDMIMDGENVQIHFTETPVEDEEAAIKQYTYYLNLEGEGHVLEVFVNDESIPFDESVL